MAVVLGVILVLTASLSLLSYFSLREQRIHARLDYLADEAEEIASFAAELSSEGVFSMFQTTRQHLNRKAQKVYEEFGAYIAVVDRWGNIMSNIQTAYSEDPDFVASLSGTEIREALSHVLAGENIRVRSTVGTDPSFTVGVPFMQYQTVTGAVLIQTKAQRIQSGMEDLLGQVAAVALILAALSAAAVSLIVRSIMRPLTALTAAAQAMGEGDFSPQLDETRGDRELRQLTKSFNGMREKLRTAEQGRREFVANVSHELRSPITSIRGFAEGMAEGVIPEEEHPKYLRLVADESRRLGRLVEDLLQLSRLEREDAALELSEFDMDEMLRRAVIRRMNDLDAKEIEVECDFRADPCLVRADSERIEQVVINLLDNAVKFTEQKGKILLRTEIREAGGRPKEGSGTGPRRLAAVTVWDNGKSIPEEDRPRVFERFFTSDRAHTSGKGTGLGLSICERILTMHGQEIRLLDTEEGAGFEFTLEAAEAST